MAVNYNKLRYFYEVTKVMNLTKAGNRLYISQSSLSKAMKDLEIFFGTELFTRQGRALLLTPSGKALQKECKRLFDSENTMIQNVKKAAMTKQQQLHFGYMLFESYYKIPGLLRQFEQQQPQTQIISRRYPERNDLTQDLLSGKLDAALKIFTMDTIIPELDCHILQKQHLSIVCPDDHPISQKASVSLADLKNDDFIMLGNDDSSSEFHFVYNWCVQCGFIPRIVDSHENVETVLMMVQSGAGISLLSEFAPLRYVNHLKSIPLENAPAIYSGLFWNKQRLTPTLELMIQYLKEQLNNEYAAH